MIWWVRRSRSSSLRRGRIALLHAAAGIDHVSSIRTHDNGIEIDIYDLGQVFRQRTQAEHQAAQ